MLSYPALSILLPAGGPGLAKESERKLSLGAYFSTDSHSQIERVKVLVNQREEKR